MLMTAIKRVTKNVPSIVANIALKSIDFSYFADHLLTLAQFTGAQYSMMMSKMTENCTT